MSKGPTYNRWRREECRDIVGLRPQTTFECLTEDKKSTILLSPSDFLYRSKGQKTFAIRGSEPLRVHVPRSLCRRVRITVNRTNKIIGETDKCF